MAHEICEWSSVTQPLPHLFSLREAVSSQENWAGLSDAGKRRKIQNRLNQRACRNRKTRDSERLSCESGERAADKYTQTSIQATSGGRVEIYIWTPVQGLNDSNGEQAKVTSALMTEHSRALPVVTPGHKVSRTTSIERGNKHSTRIAKRPPLDVCKMSDFESQITITRFERLTLRNYFLGSPAVDDLLTLIPFNMYRGIIGNAQLLGYNMDEMSPDDAISRFYNRAESDWQRQCPPSLRPTLVQHQIPHHPWLDLFPIPRMRDNMILAGSSLDENELCVNLVGFTSARAGPGIAIWGEAWDPASWEVTEAFVRDWKWILEGCDDLLRCSNKCRAQRGEKPLSF